MLKTARELILWFVNVDLSYVFKRCAVENYLSAVHDVARLYKVSSQSFVKVGIINFLLLKSALMVLWISLNKLVLNHKKLFSKLLFLLLNNQPQYHRDGFYVRNHVHSLYKTYHCFLEIASFQCFKRQLCRFLTFNCRYCFCLKCFR